MPFLLLAFTLATAVAHAAPNHALVVGGGCEEKDAHNTSDGEYGDKTGASKGHYNLFRPEFETAYHALSSNGWDTTVQYDSSAWEKPVPGAVASNKKAFFAALEREIANPGEQFLLAISSHGSPAPHFFCLGDGTYMYVKDIAPYLKRLKDKGVKVAVLDGSCYSGNTPDDLASLGVCTMSGTNPNTTGAGDMIWPYVFGLGYKPGEKVRSYYTTELPPGAPDLDQSGGVSAAEAFQYARLHMRDFMIPRTSDCKLSDHKLRQLLDGADPFLRTEGSLRQETLDASETARATLAQVCFLQKAADGFQAVLDSFDHSKKVDVYTQLLALGYPADANASSLPAHLKQKVGELGALLESVKPLQNEVDAAFAAKSPLSAELKSKISAATSKAGDLKTAIFADLRPLIHIACARERLDHPAANRPCESFKLFPARKGS
ncbi:MAG: hypothetical protein HY075_09525 [Deltaproteobacteria bacterium]|nr:hypothetical protein [Deltaproteobacteria bacterium]